MNDFTLKAVAIPEVTINDPLSELLRVGARGLIAQAVEAELAMMLMKYEDNKRPDGRPAGSSPNFAVNSHLSGPSS